MVLNKHGPIKSKTIIGNTSKELELELKHVKGILRQRNWVKQLWTDHTKWPSRENVLAINIQKKFCNNLNELFH